MTDTESCHCQAAVPSQPRDVGTICGFCPFKGRTWLGQTNFLIPAVLAPGCDPGWRWPGAASAPLAPRRGKAASPLPLCPVLLPACGNNQAS